MLSLHLENLHFACFIITLFILLHATFIYGFHFYNMFFSVKLFVILSMKRRPEWLLFTCLLRMTKEPLTIGLALS